MGGNRNPLLEKEASIAALRLSSLRRLSGQLTDKGNVDVDFFADSLCCAVFALHVNLHRNGQIMRCAVERKTPST